MKNLKIFSIFAGVNGSGKSSLFKRLGFTEDFGKRVNVDEIVKERFNNDWRNIGVQIEAGKTAARLLKECLLGDSSFNQETTLTGRTIIQRIVQAKENGFIINLYYIGLDSVELSVERVSRRVKNGGHGIDEATLRDRYSDSFENLKLVFHLCDKIQIYDNSMELTESNDWCPFVIALDGKIVCKLDECPAYLINALKDFI